MFNKALAVARNKIRRQPFSGRSKLNSQELDKAYTMLAKVARASSGKSKGLLYMTVSGVLDYLDKHETLPAYLDMPEANWLELKKSVKNSGIAVHKPDGRYFAGIAVRIT